MAEYLKLYKTMADYDAESEKVPVSHIIETVDVIIPDDRLIATFYVTSTYSPTKILHQVSAFTEIEIDGVVQPDVVSGYTFNTTGEHVIKYKLAKQNIVDTYSFFKCTKLTNVIIPKTVTQFNYCAFQYCSSLSSVTLSEIPEKVNFGETIFDSCTSLRKLNFPENVYWFGMSILNKCTGLESITVNRTTPPVLQLGLGYDTSEFIIYVPAESVNDYKNAAYWKNYSSRIQPIPTN